MKKLFLSLVAAMLAATATFAQNSGLGFNYQAVVRNANGMLLSNSDVTLRISLYPGQTAVTPSWVETHKATTDASGCFGITVGKGTRQSNSVASKYADVNFAAIYYWMKIEIQEGSNWREVSYTALPSTPYSEVAYNANTIPAGTIIPFAGPIEKIPSGWIFCDGRAVSRTTYKKLYDAIGTCWGTGDGNTTFNVPDCRGLFLRGVAATTGIAYDPDAEKRTMLGTRGGNTGNKVGSYQWDAIRNITGVFHGVDNYGQIHANTTGAFYAENNNNTFGSHSGDNDNSLVHFDASRVVPTASDNRPKNVAVTYIVKY